VLPVLGLALAACGSQNRGTDGVASLTGQGRATPSSSAGSPADARQGIIKFAACMRAHGVNMPDPKVNGGGIAINIPAGTSKATVDKAQAACKQYLPNGGEPPKLDPRVTEQLRRLAQCMRANGVPKFPDPVPGGGIQIDGRKTGIDPNDPAFKAAQKKCDHFAPKPPGGGGPSVGTGTQHGADGGIGTQQGSGSGSGSSGSGG
jgi:hypothetical protein